MLKLVIREMQIKTTLRFHLTPVRMAKFKNSGDSMCWWGCGERGTHLHCWWDCKMVQPLWKSLWWFLRKLDMTLSKNPVIPLLGIYPEDSPACNKDTCSTMFIAALFIIARSWKEPRYLSMEEWICNILWGNTFHCKAWSQKISNLQTSWQVPLISRQGSLKIMMIENWKQMWEIPKTKWLLGDELPL